MKKCGKCEKEAIGTMIGRIYHINFCEDHEEELKVIAEKFPEAEFKFNYREDEVAQA